MAFAALVMNITDSVVSALDKLATDFSWRRLTFWVGLLLLLIFLAAGFEYYSGYWRLWRIERSSNMLERLITLGRAAQDSGDPALVELYNNIRDDARSFYKTPSVGGLVVPGWALKGLAGAAPWLLIAAAYLPGVRRGEQEAVTAVLGLSLFGLIFGAIGGALPDFQWRWINYLGFPVGHFVVVAVGITVYQKRRAAKPAAGHSAATRDIADSTVP